MRILVMLLLLVVAACKPDTLHEPLIEHEPVVEDGERMFCVNEFDLLYGGDIPTVKFDLYSNPEVIKQELEEIFPGTCYKTNFFKWDHDEFNGLRLVYLNADCGSDEIEYSWRPLTVEVEPEDTVAYGMRWRIRVPTLQAGVFQDYLSYYFNEFQYTPGVHMTWSENTSRDSVIQVINNCIEGYLQAADSVAVAWYQRPVCHLEKGEVIHIREEFPFHLVFDHSYVKPPPSEEPDSVVVEL